MNAETVLTNWRTLNDALAKATEEECNKLLSWERDQQARPTFLTRIYGRMTQLRAKRERQELLGG